MTRMPPMTNPSLQRGVSTLAVTLILLVIMTAMVLFSTRMLLRPFSTRRAWLPLDWLPMISLLRIVTPLTAILTLPWKR